MIVVVLAANLQKCEKKEAIFFCQKKSDKKFEGAQSWESWHSVEMLESIFPTMAIKTQQKMKFFRLTRALCDKYTK